MPTWLTNTIQSAVLAAVVTGIIGLIAIVLRQKPAMVKMEDDRHAAEVARLDARIAELSEQVKTAMAQVAAISAQRDADRAEFDRRISEERRRHEKIATMMRHRLRNEQQAMTTMLELLEMNPDRVTEIVSRVRVMRTENERLAAIESGEALKADPPPS